MRWYCGGLGLRERQLELRTYKYFGGVLFVMIALGKLPKASGFCNLSDYYILVLFYVNEINGL